VSPETRTATRVPSQRRARQTRARLVEAAEQAFAETGYAKTTTAAIARRAGVATGTVYQYFADKDALLREIAIARLVAVSDSSLTSLESDDGALAARVRAAMATMVSRVMAYHRHDPGLHAVLTERRHCDPELDAITSHAEGLLVDRVAALLERWGHRGDVEATAFVLFGMVEGSVHAHVLGAPKVDDERFVHALTHALIRVAMPTLNAASEDTKPCPSP
jgi:AcrR family transcriptional regulator